MGILSRIESLLLGFHGAADVVLFASFRETAVAGKVSIT